MKQHIVKSRTKNFENMVTGDSTAEIRKNDRKYRKGDSLLLCEWSAKSRRYTGKTCRLLITNVLNDQNALKPGYVCISVKFTPGGLTCFSMELVETQDTKCLARKD